MSVSKCKKEEKEQLPLVAKIGIGVGVICTSALLGVVAAPVLAGMIGVGMMGLSGAAATSAGLAALGGGSLAAGGMGMAGGTAVVGVVGAAVGATGVGVGISLSENNKAIHIAKKESVNDKAIHIAKKESVNNRAIHVQSTCIKYPPLPPIPNVAPYMGPPVNLSIIQKGKHTVHSDLFEIILFDSLDDSDIECEDINEGDDDIEGEEIVYVV